MIYTICEEVELAPPRKNMKTNEVASSRFTNFKGNYMKLRSKLVESSYIDILSIHELKHLLITFNYIASNETYPS